MNKFLSNIAPIFFAIAVGYVIPIGNNYCGVLDGQSLSCPRDVNMVLTTIFIIILAIIFYIIKLIIKKIKTKPIKPIKIVLNIILILALLYAGILTRSLINQYDSAQIEPDILKPIIYLYPEKEMKVNVSLNVDGKLVYSYPNYNDGWTVNAYPDGKIINHDGKEYSYLFWESSSNYNFNLKEGFVVQGEDTVKFLQEKLAYLGLTPKEYNEFIVFWYPKMANNNYNLIYFAKEDYTDHARLEITPKPDSILRVFMVFKPLNNEITIKEQELDPFERTGFSVIEWGGTEL